MLVGCGVLKYPIDQPVIVDDHLRLIDLQGFHELSKLRVHLWEGWPIGKDRVLHEGFERDFTEKSRCEMWVFRLKVDGICLDVICERLRESEATQVGVNRAHQLR